ncbi:MAG: hypothetical protein CMN72_02165 [Sphingomonas sp.]|jgi:hypothetical protein|nr:hypothetical protein [Sphingomonas sp.]
MSTSFYDLTVGTYLRTATAVAGILQKGADHFAAEGIDPVEVVATRLYPDMANFHFQVTSVTHHSIGAVRGFESGEFRPPRYDDCDYAALQAMTTETLEALQSKSRDEIDALAEGKVVFKMGSTKIPFTAQNFALSFSLPNFYFHATTAYDILRMKGVKLGKMDFLGAMAAGA